MNRYDFAKELKEAKALIAENEIFKSNSEKFKEFANILEPNLIEPFLDTLKTESLYDMLNNPKELDALIDVIIQIDSRDLLFNLSKAIIENINQDFKLDPISEETFKNFNKLPDLVEKLNIIKARGGLEEKNSTVLRPLFNKISGIFNDELYKAYDSTKHKRFMPEIIKLAEVCNVQLKYDDNYPKFSSDLVNNLREKFMELKGRVKGAHKTYQEAKEEISKLSELYDLKIMNTAFVGLFDELITNQEDLHKITYLMKADSDHIPLEEKNKIVRKIFDANKNKLDEEKNKDLKQEIYIAAWRFPGSGLYKEQEVIGMKDVGIEVKHTNNPFIDYIKYIIGSVGKMDETEAAEYIEFCNERFPKNSDLEKNQASYAISSLEAKLLGKTIPEPDKTQVLEKIPEQVPSAEESLQQNSSSNSNIDVAPKVPPQPYKLKSRDFRKPDSKDKLQTVYRNISINDSTDSLQFYVDNKAVNIKELVNNLFSQNEILVPLDAINAMLKNKHPDMKAAFYEQLYKEMRQYLFVDNIIDETNYIHMIEKLKNFDIIRQGMYKYLDNHAPEYKFRKLVSLVEDFEVYKSLHKGVISSIDMFYLQTRQGMELLDYIENTKPKDIIAGFKSSGMDIADMKRFQENLSKLCSKKQGEDAHSEKLKEKIAPKVSQITTAILKEIEYATLQQKNGKLTQDEINEINEARKARGAEEYKEDTGYGKPKKFFDKNIKKAGATLASWTSRVAHSVGLDDLEESMVNKANKKLAKLTVRYEEKSDSSLAKRVKKSNDKLRETKKVRGV